MRTIIRLIVIAALIAVCAYFLLYSGSASIAQDATDGYRDEYAEQIIAGRRAKDGSTECVTFAYIEIAPGVHRVQCEGAWNGQ